ncbi:MAG: hypothetical protein NZ891_08330 [bacterium]|nr:hypothetical protein [bacterium]MDW8164727.1 hypothetical protein [Candidatus Omnitrophota bacterium]
MYSKKLKIFILLIVIFFLISFLLFPALYNARKCIRVAICFSNVKIISIALSQYARDYDGFYPIELSMLYPKYVNNLRVFICLSKSKKIKEEDILKNFEVCYIYNKGLTKKSPSELLLLYEKGENHKNSCGRKNIRHVVFVEGRVKGVDDDEWLKVYNIHLKNLQSADRKD